MPKARPTPAPAPDLPVARVVVDVPLAHLDRLFDYQVSADQHEVATPGARVRVRFAGQQVGGFVAERVAGSEHGGRLSPLTRAVSPEPVLSPEVLELARAVADRYAGSLADVLRLAVPPRHARVEAAPPRPVADDPPAPAGPGPWERYRDGAALLQALQDGRAPRAVWTALPGGRWPEEIALAVQATLAGGRGAVVVVPDTRDAARVDAALSAALGEGRHVVLTAEVGPAERYRRWLAVRRGAVRAVVGTRAAMFAPVRALGLVVVWDDGDDLHAEPRAPYPKVRDVLVLRAHLAGAGALVAGHTVTAEGAQLVRSGWARPLAAGRDGLRAAVPLIRAAGQDADLARDPAARSARLPTVAWETAREGLAEGPVLVQVPRRGYVPALACATCRSSARCPACAGPLGQPTGRDRGAPTCRWCGRPATGWSCPACGDSRLRATVVGAGRTAEELGRAFPGVPVRLSGGDRVLATVQAERALVVATPGAEPVAAGGYAAALLLDGWALLTRADLRAGEEALRRWANAAAMVRPGPAGGRVVVLADGGAAPVQALLRWRPGWLAERELADRQELGFPPAVRMAAVTGRPAAVADLLAAVDLPACAEVLGPVPEPDQRPGEPPAERALLRVPRKQGRALAAALKTVAAQRSARKAADPVRIELDPLVLA